MEESLLDIGGVRVHLFRGGAPDAPPLLYLHGGAPSGVWLPLHERLAQTFHVVAPDLPGFGGTEAPEWVEGIDDFLLVTRELMALLGLERPHVVGFSVGGWLAAELAVFYPEHVDRLVLAAAIGLHVDAAPVMDLFALSGEALSRALLYDYRDAPRLFGNAPTMEDRVRQFRELTMLARIAWNPHFDPKLVRRLRRVTSPTLLLWGDHDRLVPPAHGEAFRDALPDARLHFIPECGHMLPLEKPEAFADAISAFLLMR